MNLLVEIRFYWSFGGICRFVGGVFGYLIYYVMSQITTFLMSIALKTREDFKRMLLLMTFRTGH